MATKKYWLKPDQIRPLLTQGGKCVASDRITVYGHLVGYMYRDKPANTLDSGWRFLSGEESPRDMADPSRHGMHDVNIIANFDTAIIPLLNAPLGAAFSRDWKTFQFAAVKK